MSGYLQDLFGLDGQVAVVVGGTGTLCGRMCEALAAAGATVVVAGRDQAAAAEKVSSIAAAGGKAHPAAVDLTDRRSITALLDGTLDQFGRIDVLINGGGVNDATPYAEIDSDTWQQVFRINMQGLHESCQTFTPALIRTQGCIVNVGSASSLTPLSRVFAYSASKAAVRNYTHNLARELAPRNVRVNCLIPGFFPAEQNRKILSPERVEDIMRHTPMDRFGEPSELDGAVLLLASRKAGGFVTGSDLVVDGGFSCQTI